MVRWRLRVGLPVRKAYEANKLNILEWVDASRTANETKEDCEDALYGYQRAVLNLESTAGQSIEK